MKETLVKIDLPAALKDAKCDSETAKVILVHEQQGNTAEAIRLLTLQRRRMMDTLHEAQRAVDCIDYLLHGLK